MQRAELVDGLNLVGSFVIQLQQFELNFKMLSQESQYGDKYLKCSEKASQCSTNIPFSAYYEQSFYIGTEEFLKNLGKIQLNQDKIVYEFKRVKRSLLLSLTVMEQSIYLRNQKTVFAIKLTRSQQSITLSTFQKDKFIGLYLNLAKHCILKSFQKHYRVGKQLGTGAFGIVYDGYNLISSEIVALKVISKDQISKTQNGMKMLQNQIKILQKLRNYQISPLISTYETVDCFIMVLEKGSGGNLLDYIQSHSHNYGEKMLRLILKQVLENLNLLHQAGYIHRDIKPENIICKDTVTPSIFLCDYGIAVRKSQMCFDEQDKHIAGTVGYIAPQILNQNSFDEKSDIFSVGCVFYYLFTGQKLFETKNFFQLKFMTQNSDYIRKRIKLLKFLNLETRNLLQQMLSYNPEKRPSALEALRNQYFKESEVFVPNLSVVDDTLREFLQNKICHYWRKIK